MSKTNWKTRAVTAAVMTGLMGFAAHAQEDMSKQEKHESKQGKAVGEAAARRVQYVGKLAVFNNRQIKLARLAEQQATDPQVKQFATKLREDHENSQSQLRDWAQQKKVEVSALSDSNQTSEAQGTGGSGVQEGYQEKMKGSGEKLGKAVDETNAEITKLQAKQGPEFDKAFLTRIAEDQKKGKDILKEGRKEYKNDASFLALLSDTERTVSGNETQAKELEKQMKKQ
ncbi:DUF4142 domain-containing protein [Corallococcus sp. AB049A]|uniref:DUF4142 domain-containing protein n=1 Tax=Corallococcus interemptor TaxID=2316720 RepID=A0A3A8QP86_9BACT|nr:MULTISPECIES: DUF4142 domain-containing protein [Corallococcus]RKH52427.1 DUF4142 domain-containing protein [Corallococcus sp. AB050B]RKH68165.1 DUF4142 domain-containing protein [Corallococcus interemptor]RKI67703.1 DUF4142 domain-containing protein [Corallococcus sp. AB049A]